MRWSTWRMLAAVVAISGVVAGFIVNIARGTRMNENLALVVVDYVSYFTIVSAIATIVVLIVGARSRPLTAPDGVESRAVAVWMATTSAAMIILGIVYNALLRGLPASLVTPDLWFVAFLDRWSVETLHVVIPLFIIVDVLFGPRRRRLGWSALVAIVAFPLAWVVYTMLRGPFAPAPDGSTRFWYPYPFLNPNAPSGYSTPMIYIGGIAVGFLVVGVVLILLTHRRRRAINGPDAGSPAAESDRR
jgi:hypothetical protein